MNPATETHYKKIHLICGLVIASLVGAVCADIFDAYGKMHLELYFSIGMAFTMVIACFISIWTFLDWREDKKRELR